MGRNCISTGNGRQRDRRVLSLRPTGSEPGVFTPTFGCVWVDKWAESLWLILLQSYTGQLLATHHLWASASTSSAFHPFTFPSPLLFTYSSFYISLLTSPVLLFSVFFSNSLPFSIIPFLLSPSPFLVYHSLLPSSPLFCRLFSVSFLLLSTPLYFTHPSSCSGILLSPPLLLIFVLFSFPLFDLAISTLFILWLVSVCVDSREQH